MNDVTFRKEQRRKYLIRVYRETKGDLISIVNMFTIGFKMNLSREDVEKIVTYLVDEGYLEHKHSGGGISITISGLIEVEEMLVVNKSEDVRVIKEQRAKFIQLVYEKSEGDTSNILEISEIGDELEFPEELLEKIYFFFLNIEFIDSYGAGGSFSITHFAVQTLEEAFLETENEEKSENEIVKEEKLSCFISYSWDSDEHKKWVRKLAEDLQHNGIFTYLDEWDTKLGGDLPQYMEKCITESDYILLVCTPTYAEKANDRRGGVGYEHTIITGELFTSTNEDSKYIPILKQGEEKVSKPHYFKTKIHCDFRDPAKYEDSIDELLRGLHNVPKYKRPELGSKPDFLNAVSNVKNASIQSVEIFYSISYGSKLYEARQLRTVFGVINLGIKNNTSHTIKYPKLGLNISSSSNSRDIKMPGLETNIQEGFEIFYGGANIVINPKETLVFVSYSYKIDAESRKFKDISLDYSISGEDILPVTNELIITKKEILDIIFDPKTGVKLKI